VINVCVGEAHSGAWTAGGQLYMWGDGDLLQIGNGEEEEVLSPHHVKSKQLSSRLVLGADGGSQHSIVLGKPNPDLVEWVVVSAATPSDSTVQPPGANAAEEVVAVDDEIPEPTAEDLQVAVGAAEEDNLPEPTEEDVLLAAGADDDDDDDDDDDELPEPTEEDIQAGGDGDDDDDELPEPTEEDLQMASA